MAKRTILESKVIEVFKKFVHSNFSKVSFHKIYVSPLHNKGFPDLLVVIEGVTIFVEAKAPGGVLSKNQQATLKKLHDSGAKTFVMDCHKEDKSKLNFYSFDKTPLFSLDVKEEHAGREFKAAISTE